MVVTGSVICGGWSTCKFCTHVAKLDRCSLSSRCKDQWVTWVGQEPPHKNEASFLSLRSSCFWRLVFFRLCLYRVPAAFSQQVFVACYVHASCSNPTTSTVAETFVGTPDMLKFQNDEECWIHVRTGLNVSAQYATFIVVVAIWRSRAVFVSVC